MGDDGPDVRVVRRKIGLPDDGPYDRIAVERIKGMARHKNVATDGTVTEGVAQMLGESAANAAGLTPQWYERDLQLWFQGEDVLAVRQILQVDNLADDRYDPDLEAAVRRFQSSQGLDVDGLVTADLAMLLGEVA